MGRAIEEVLRDEFEHEDAIVTGIDEVASVRSSTVAVDDDAETTVPTNPAFATTGMPGPTPDDVPSPSSTVAWKSDVAFPITSPGMSGMPAT